MNSKAITTAVNRWLDTFVVGMNLCPFAGQEITQGRVRLIATEARDEETLLADLQEEVLALVEDASIETTLLIHPLVLNDFFDYNDFLGVCDTLLQDMNAEGEFQIASFHPQYRFAETAAEDPENYANRSPYPLLHILRESSLTRAIDSHPNVEQIPENNIARLNDFGATQLRKLWVQLNRD